MRRTAKRQICNTKYQDFINKKIPFLKRQYGHYVNAYSCKGKSILIADPYSKNKSLFYIELDKLSGIRIKNPKR